MRRLRSWVLNRALDFVDSQGELLGVECLSYGGHNVAGQPRLCRKWRWHTDSHAYETKFPK